MWKIKIERKNVQKQKVLLGVVSALGAAGVKVELVTVLADGILCTFTYAYLVVFLIFLKHRFTCKCFVYRHVYVYSCFWFLSISSSLSLSLARSLSLMLCHTFTLDYLFCKSHGARFVGKTETIKATATTAAAKQNRWMEEMATIAHTNWTSSSAIFFFSFHSFVSFVVFVCKSDWLGLLVIIMQWNGEDNVDDERWQRRRRIRSKKMKIHCIE